MSIRRSSITVFVAMFAASTLSACGDQRQDDAQGPGQEASASAGSGLISAQSGFAEMDLASVKAVKSFGLCAVDAINGHGGKDAAKTINLTRAGKVKVSGWAVTPDKRSPSSVAVVLLGTERAYAPRADGGRAREDVARSVASGAGGDAEVGGGCGGEGGGR